MLNILQTNDHLRTTSNKPDVNGEITARCGLCYTDLSITFDDMSILISRLVCLGEKLIAGKWDEI